MYMYAHVRVRESNLLAKYNERYSAGEEWKNKSLSTLTQEVI